MPAITLSDGFISGANGVMARMMSLNAKNDNQNLLGLLSGGSTSPQVRNGIISIMKGTVPTNFNSLTDYSSRSADVLVQWAVSNTASKFDVYSLTGQFNSSVVTTNPATISTSFIAATASGTATWFWWVTRGYGWQGSSNELFEQIIGTVGLPGTGADLEIPSTSVTTGQLFRIIDLRMQIATSYSY